MSHAVYQNLISFSCTFSTNSLNDSGAANNSLLKSSDSKDIGKICSCVVILCKNGDPNVLKMLCWPHNTSPDLHHHHLDHMLQ